MKTDEAVQGRVSSVCKTGSGQIVRMGCRVWGKAQAQKWLRNIYATCKERLQRFPLGCPVAPESEDLGREVRPLVIGRYRAIFVVKDNTVTILHIRGAYAGQASDNDDD